MDPSKARQLLLKQRLANQRLAGAPFATALDAVARFGAVQAQDFGAAKWAVAQRMGDAYEETLERALDHGEILRTHVLRPTWHLVAARDIKWMLALTAPRIVASAAYSWRTAGLDADVFKRTNKVIAKALEPGEHLTRAELADALRRAQIEPGDGVRMGHIMLRAELDAIVCSGAQRGKQPTYALLDARAPLAPTQSRDDSLRELAIRYFSTRGPATAKDFAWWSGLTIGDARNAIHLADDALASETIADEPVWVGSPPTPTAKGTSVHLLPNFDEFLVAYSDRAAMAGALSTLQPAESKRAIFSNIVEIDGQVAGLWQRKLDRTTATIHVRPLRTFTGAERKAVGAQVKRYGQYVSREAQVEFDD